MKILIYGAGVIGRIFSYHLHECGQDVTVLARGKTYRDLEQNGIEIYDKLNNKKYQSNVSLIEKLERNDFYEIILVTMQQQHIKEILPILKENNSKIIVFVGNNIRGFEDYSDFINRERILLGFGGPGGYREGNKIIAAKVDEPILYIGEPDNTVSNRLKIIKKKFQSCGLKVEIIENMDAWLKSHGAFVIPIALAIHIAHKENKSLTEKDDLLNSCILAIRENIKALDELGIPIFPRKLKWLKWIPIFLLKYMFKKLYKSEFGKIALAGHSITAPAEFKSLMNDFKNLLGEKFNKCPNSAYLDKLSR